jgi:nucleotide-binding universal stress UspA family protein
LKEEEEMLNRVLVPLDGSKVAEQVFPAVTELASALDLEVVIAGVCELEEKEEGQTCRLYINDKTEQLEGRLAGSAATVKTVVLFGKPAEQILSYAEVEKVDLIIMSSHGRSGIMPWSLGSTVDKVFKKAGIPLIVVRAKEPPEEARLFSRIVVPLDGSEKSTAVLPYIRELANVLPCEVFPVQVVEAGRHVRTIGGLDYVRFIERDISSTKAAVKKYLEGVCIDLALTKAKVNCEVRVGDPAREILKFADEKGCTLIAISSHGHHGIEAWALGSVTSKIVEVSKQPVWLVPSFARK